MAGAGGAFLIRSTIVKVVMRSICAYVRYRVKYMFFWGHLFEFYMILINNNLIIQMTSEISNS